MMNLLFGVALSLLAAAEAQIVNPLVIPKAVVEERAEQVALKSEACDRAVGYTSRNPVQSTSTDNNRSVRLLHPSSLRKSSSVNRATSTCGTQNKIWRPHVGSSLLLPLMYRRFLRLSRKRSVTLLSKVVDMRGLLEQVMPRAV